MHAGGIARLISESETPRGWRYRFEHAPLGDGATQFDLTLAWHDHEDIAGGGTPPSELATAAAEILIAHWSGSENGAQSQRIPADRIDLSTARRLIPGFTEAVRARLSR